MGAGLKKLRVVTFPLMLRQILIGHGQLARHSNITRKQEIIGCVNLTPFSVLWKAGSQQER